MKICCLHSSDEGIEAGTEDPEDVWPDPGLFTDQHSFENKYLVKATAKAQIDELIAEGYDFYLNFIWGTNDDAIAGVEAVKYFESFRLPSAGVRSEERQRSKFDFFAEAKRLGSLPIPSTTNFPLFVKPAFDYASKLIDEHSLCHNEAELDATLKRLNEKMRGLRLHRAHALKEDPEQYANACEVAGRHSTDLVVQEFIDGEDYSVVVLAMGHVPVPLTPLVAKHTKQLPGKEQYLTYDIKYDTGSGYELLLEDQNPGLYRELQRIAVEAFKETQSHTSNMGCEVDFRVRRDDQKPFIIEVDPLPIWFFPPGSRYEDLDVQHDFPGGHRAAINIFITNYFLRHTGNHLGGSGQPIEDDDIPTSENFDHLFTRLPHAGTVLDLACRNGLIGRALVSAAPRPSQPRWITGVNSSEKILQLCRQGGWYNELILEGIVQLLARYDQKVDHIFCLSGIDILSVEELDFVLARCFQLANSSITLRTRQVDKAAGIKSFGEPRGWSLTYYGSTPSATGIDSTTFRFERE